VDKLLREIENPNLHDIRNMSFRVELWDQHALHIRWVVAAAGSVFLARAAFEEAVKQWPGPEAHAPAGDHAHQRASLAAWKSALNALNGAPRLHRSTRGYSEAKNFCGTQKASEAQGFWGIVQR
jgi:hypothetical protein